MLAAFAEGLADFCYKLPRDYVDLFQSFRPGHGMETTLTLLLDVKHI